jgi:DNA-binding transcriptional LysR family regulator
MEFVGMDAGELRVFEAVARLGAMNRAATELNTVQSNVTTRIRLLEEDLGTPLFDRHSRGVSMTAAGRRLLPYARRIAHLLDEAHRAVKDDGSPKGMLTIGSLETTAAIRLSPVLADYAAAYPDVDLVFRTGTTNEMIKAVLDRTVDGAFLCGPVDHPDLETETVFHEELVVATAPAVRSFDELTREKEAKIVVLRAGCSYRQRLEEILARRGVVGLRTLEFGTIEAILGCVAAGLGVTLLPRGIVTMAQRDRAIAMHELPPAESRVDTVFIHRRDAFISSTLTEFTNMTRQACVQPQAAE